MTIDEAKQWHAALASAAAQLSISITRRSFSPRMFPSLVALLRPVLRDMEVESIKHLAVEKVTREAAALSETLQPQRQQRKRTLR